MEMEQGQGEGQGKRPACKNLISLCGNFIAIIAIVVFFIWLIPRISVFVPPICTMEKFDVVALNKATNNTQANQTIHYDLKLKNANRNNIYYDAINVTFYYKPNISFPIATATYPAFSQGFWRSTHRVTNMEPKGTFWENASTAVKFNGSAVFRVKLVTSVRYGSFIFKTKRHHVMVAADLVVNDEGKLVEGKKNKGIQLSSGSRITKGCFALMGLLVISVFLLL